MSSAEQKVRAALGGPDLWLKDDGNLQGYGDKPGAGPWWSAESIERLALERDKACEHNKKNLRKLAALQATPTEGELTVRENGEANSYALLQRGDWLMNVQLNGKLMEAKQLATLHKMAASWNAFESEGWNDVRVSLPELHERVLAGYWYRDTWAAGEPWEFSVGICSMYEYPNNPCFPQGRRWQTHGCSHSAITHWRRMPAFPAMPQELGND